MALKRALEEDLLRREERVHDQSIKLVDCLRGGIASIS